MVPRGDETSPLVALFLDSTPANNRIGGGGERTTGVEALLGTRAVHVINSPLLVSLSLSRRSAVSNKAGKTEASHGFNARYERESVCASACECVRMCAST